MKNILLFIVCLLFVSDADADNFVPYVSATNQPNCVVGAFCMYAEETLNVKLAPWTLEHSCTNLDDETVLVTDIPVVWNKMFPTNKLNCIYSLFDTNYDTNTIVWNKPYVWIGKWDTTNNEYHACLVYFNSNFITFKHFVYDPATGTNYMVKRNYQFFFDRTFFLYSDEKLF